MAGLTRENRHVDRFCGAPRRNGLPCTKYKIVGEKRCRNHLGKKSPVPERLAEERLRKMKPADVAAKIGTADAKALLE